MLHEFFLAYADQDRPPLDPQAVCRKIEMRLDPLSPDTKITTHGTRLGIMISSSRVDSQAELWVAVEPILPPGVFADPRS